jgi:hypothetical protein
MRRALAKDEVDLRIGNGAKVVALAVGTTQWFINSTRVLLLCTWN